MNTAILLISCPDRKGIVATVSQFLYKYNANIIDANQHQDSDENLFLTRIEWEITDFLLNEEAFKKEFADIAKEFQMEWHLSYSSNKPKVAILISKEDHCLADLLYRYKQGDLHCEISCIISNHSNALELAKSHGIPFYITPPSDEKEKIEETILTYLKKYNVDLVVLARYMQILSSNFIKQYPNKIINIHHSFLPAFAGAKPYHQAHERGVKIIGATSHYAISELDNGPIIEQDVARITHRDSVQELVQKGRDLERIVLARAVKWHLENRILTYNNKTIIFE